MIEQRKTYCQDCEERCKNAFAAAQTSALRAVDEQKRTLIFARGEKIFSQDDTTDSFYCVQSGTVQIYRNSAEREHSFSIAGPGQWIGHRDVLLGRPRSHNARTLNRAVVCKFPARLLAESLTRDPAVQMSLLKEMAAGWEQAERQSYNLGARSVTERLADFLLALSHEEEEETELPCTREVIGSLTGTTTETVIRTLSAFKARGWIDTSKGRVHLRKKNELRKLVAES